MYKLSNLLDELYAAIDIPEAVPELNPTDSGENWTLDCPYCGQHEAHAFKKNIGCIVCRGSVEPGRVFTLYRYYTDVKKLGTMEALMVLADLGRYPLDVKSEEMEVCEKEQRQMTLLEEAESFFVAELWADRGSPAMQFLTEKKKFTEDEIRGMRLGLFSSRERLAVHLQKHGYSENDERDLKFTYRGLGDTHTLTMPYRDPVGNLKGFAVMPADASHKSGSPCLFTASRDTLFNLHEARGRGILVVAKHPIDALIASQRGIKEIVATGGDGLTGPLLDTAARYGANGFVLCHDLDDPERGDTLRAIDLIRREQRGMVFVVDLPEKYGDLGGFLRDRDMAELVKLAFRKSNEGVQWKANRILEKYSDEKHADQGIYLALNDIKAFHAELTDPSDRETVVDIVSERLGADRKSLKESVESFRGIKAREDLRRHLSELSKDISRKGDRDPEGVLRSLPRRIKELTLRHEGAVVKAAQPFREFFSQRFDVEMERAPDGLLGYRLQTFPEIAENLDGIQPGLYVIGGHPDVGKTALMTNLFLDLLLSNPETEGVYFSFDGNREVMRSRLMSIRTGIPRNQVQKGHDSPITYAKMKKAHNDLMSFVALRRLAIKDLSEISDMDDLELEIRRRAGDDFIVFIDGLNNLRTGDLVLEQVDKANRIKQWIDTYRIPVFCTVNLRKPAGDGRGPNLADVTEIEHYWNAASAVLFLIENQKVNADRGASDPVQLTLKFEKNKLSDFKGAVQLIFMPSTGVVAETQDK